MSEILKWRSPTEAQAKRPSREEALEAVRTLIAWAGDDPDREGLKDTPKRVIEQCQRRLRLYEDATREN